MDGLWNFISSYFMDVENFLRIDARSAFFCMLGSLICGLMIFAVYKFFYKGVVYSDNFNILLVLVNVVTAFIIMVVGSNIVLSLGMVGALRIVRFRTAIKDPLDVGFLLWAISAGIACGAALYKIAVPATVMIALIYVFMTRLVKFKTLYLMVLHYDLDHDLEKAILDAMGGIKYKIKNKTESARGAELIVQFGAKKFDTGLTSKLRAIEGVHSVSIVEYDGDYAQ